MSKQNPETLVDWYEQWLNQIKKEGHFAERIVEIYDQGIGTQIPNIVLLDLYKKYSSDIWKLLCEDWTASGFDGVISYLASHNIEAHDDTDLKCALTAQALQLLLRTEYERIMEIITKSENSLK